MPGFWKVGVDKNNEYVVGLVERSPDGYILCPFIGPRAGFENGEGRVGRVKLRIHDVRASEIVPIYKNDPLNTKFFKPLREEHIRIGEIRE